MTDRRFDALNCHELYASLAAARHGVLCVTDHGQPYAVPLDYTVEERDGCYTFYFDCAAQGMLARCVRRCAKACLTVRRDTPQGVESIVAQGRATVRAEGNAARVRLYTRDVTGRLYYPAAQAETDA